MEIGPGVRIGAFEIRTVIGAGGMGSVYQARDHKLGRDVAIKILHDRFAGNSDYLRRFEREARSASALNHPNILTVFEINESNGTPFIAMELIEGSRLRDLLHNGPLPIRKLLSIATQIADGLAAAHDRGIVHRDLKPENVMITPHGLVKILDFGLARPEPDSARDDLVTGDTITKEYDRKLLGTAGYMSPEQATGQAVDQRSDQFSLGAVLYEMATGRRAFGGDSIPSMIAAVVRAEPQPVQELNPRIPAPLRWVIERCLARHPSDRYASTADLARELHTLQERLPDTGSGSGSFPFLVFSRRRTVLWVSAGVLAVAAAAHLWMRNPSGAVVLTAPPHVAVLPFSDSSGKPDGALFSRGLAEAVSARLQKFPSIQVIPPTATAALSDKGSNPRRIAEELGATFILSASVHSIGDTLQVKWALRDSIRNQTVATDTVSGSADNVWALQDDLSQTIARRLGLQQQSPQPTQQAELETAEEQDLYLRALGHLVNQHEDPKALDAALSLLRELLESAAGSPLVHAALARTYLEKYNLTKDTQFSERAVQAAARARALAPDSAEVLHAQASVQRFTGRFKEAITTYKRSLTLEPNSAEAVIGLAKSYQGAGQIEDAERTYIRAARLRPTWWSSYNELGVLYLTRGRYDEAATQFEKVTQLNPNTPWGHTNLGVVHVTKERLPEAIASFTRANTLREDPAAYANLGYCYYYLGQYDRSADAYRKAAALRPQRATYWTGLADACQWTSRCRDESAGANSRAIELLRQELATNPGLARARASLAVCLAKAGRASEAEEQIKEALRIEPENPARMFQAARVANMNGKPAEAVAWLRRASDGGYGRFELPRDPEFGELRKSEAFRSMFNN